MPGWTAKTTTMGAGATGVNILLHATLFSTHHTIYSRQHRTLYHCSTAINFWKMSEQRKAVIKNADMDEKMQQDAVDIASKALSEYNIEKVSEFFFPLHLINGIFCLLLTVFIIINYQDVAAYIKKEFDRKYNPTWHVIVGRNFGSYVTHETKHFIYFYLGQVAVLLFKSG